MRFLWSDLLWLLLIVPVLIGGYVYALRRRKKLALRYASLMLVREAIGPGHQAEIDASVRVWVREVHPEVVFARISPDGQGLAHSKRGCKACRGTPCSDADIRVTLLRRYVTSFDPDAARAGLLQAFRQERARADGPGFSGVSVGRDDVVDAVACLVSAGRIVRGEAVRLPAGDPPTDDRGLRMEILA